LVILLLQLQQLLLLLLQWLISSMLHETSISPRMLKLSNL
jgi:hypothetical protein